MKAFDESELKRRRFPRLKTPVFYRPLITSEKKRRASDLSLGGVRIYSNKPVKEKQLLEIELFLPNGKAITAVARIVWIKALPPGSSALYDMGLEFISLSPEALRELKSILNETSCDE